MYRTDQIQRIQLDSLLVYNACTGYLFVPDVGSRPVATATCQCERMGSPQKEGSNGKRRGHHFSGGL